MNKRTFIVTASLHLLLGISFLVGSLGASPNVENHAIINQRAFLENLAKAEPEYAQIKPIDEAAVKEALNGLKDAIFESEDIELITLYQRAARNFNSFSSLKADPTPIYYKHYREPAFFVPEIDLTLEVNENDVRVVSKLVIRRNKNSSTLILNGVDHLVDWVKINGMRVPRDSYFATYQELILQDIPLEEEFTVEIQSRINPYINSSMEGMYLSGNWLTTQCESEGARKIFFTLDRPDVLSRIRTTIIADPLKYPYRLSNGNLISESDCSEGKKTIIWQDPIPKPCYLFACVLGDFGILKSSYRTKSGKPVELQVYVEKGKEARASYSLEALKKAMEFDELFFDREYDLSCMKMVGMPNFNSGAMENKGLMIFNETALLVDARSGTDGSFRRVAGVVGHEYFHNWSGNRVTIRNWFEIALKEAFTDWRAIKFVEWLFGEEFIRPKDVSTLRELQFPEEIAENGHPIMVEHYIDPHSIYDHTTYTKGREVFRTFQIFVDSLIPGGFREVLNNYFSLNDGKAVTFRELLSAADEVLARVGKNTAQFERWFLQPGTPIVNVKMKDLTEEGRVEFIVTQSCSHPKTGKMQDPFVIPFSLELLGKNGVISQKVSTILEEDQMTFHFSVNERPAPIFMHGYSAPVILEYDYSAEDLFYIIKYTDDPFNRWDAAQKYAFSLLKEMAVSLAQDPDLELRAAEGEEIFSSLFSSYKEILKNPALSPLAKSQILQIPTIRSISQELKDYDFAKIAKLRALFLQQLALSCRSILKELIANNRGDSEYAPTAEQMQIRELNNRCLSLLSGLDDEINEMLYATYRQNSNFNDTMAAFVNCIATKNPYKVSVIKDFYDKWKNDSAVFNYWLSSQASMPDCTVDLLVELAKVDGYNCKNPNHIRSVVLTFIMNLGCFHDSEGRGYAYVVDKILEVGTYNPQLAHNYLALPAFQDIEQLPASQKALMFKELKRLQVDEAAPQTRALVEKLLE